MPLVYKGAPYGVDERARCQHLMPHASPAEDCTCGFYAMSQAVRYPPWLRRATWDYVRRHAPADQRLLPFRILLDVDLSGTVIVADRGYRAERQRVLRALLDPCCSICGDQAQGGFAPTFLRGERPAPLWPTCGCQRPVTHTLSTLTGMFETEVVWDPERRPIRARRRT